VPSPAALLDRIRRDVERSTIRTRNGLKHLAGVGRPAVGSSPKDVVWRRDKVQLYRYHSNDRTVRPPILLVMSLVSKPYVLDLRPGNSFIEALLARGLDVFLLDWGVPDATESQNTFETYCDTYIPFACAASMRPAAKSDVNCRATCATGLDVCQTANITPPKMAHPRMPTMPRLSPAMASPRPR